LCHPPAKLEVNPEIPNQGVFLVQIEGYAYVVPYVETESELFLKTIIPSRKATKEHLQGKRILFSKRPSGKGFSHLVFMSMKSWNP